MNIRMIHTADIHLGYGSQSLIFGEEEDFAGRYVREVDIERTLQNLTTKLLKEVPAIDLVVVAGDCFHRSSPRPRAVRAAAEFFNRLAQSGIEIVIIDGNHETSSWRHTGSPTSYLREFGVHVVNGVFHRTIHNEAWHSTHLRDANIAVHALPYRAVLERHFTGVLPLKGYFNILLTHGRAQGIDNLNSLNRTAAHIPIEVLRRGWDYIALGDWHIHGLQPIPGVPAYYAGSLEALNYKEAATYPPRADDQNATRGVLDVRFSSENAISVSSLPNLEARPVLRLKPINASDLEPEALMEILRQRLTPEIPSEALVFLEVENCPRSIWEQLNYVEIDQLRQQFRRCDIRWEVIYPEIQDSIKAARAETLDNQWQRYVSQIMADDSECDWYIEQGNKLIETALEQSSRADEEM